MTKELKRKVWVKKERVRFLAYWQRDTVSFRLLSILKMSKTAAHKNKVKLMVSETPKLDSQRRKQLSTNRDAHQLVWISLSLSLSFVSSQTKMFTHAHTYSWQAVLLFCCFVWTCFWVVCSFGQDRRRVTLKVTPNSTINQNYTL